MITRRAIVNALASGLLTRPIGALAQKAERVYRLGRLMMGRLSELDNEGSRLEKALLDELARLGYVKGRNLVLEYRSADGDPRRLDSLAAELVAAKVDLIFTSGGSATARAAKKATATIPIVVEMVGDPVGRGLVASLARPGGNLTGNAVFHREIGVKRVQMLVEALGKPTRIGFLLFRGDWNVPESQKYALELAVHARSAGAQIQVFEIAAFDDLDAAFERMVRDRVDGLVVDNSPFTANSPNLDQIALLISKHRLPAIAEGRQYSETGTLLTYSLDVVAAFRNAADYIARILQGANPGDLPLQLPLRYQLIINLRTAKALGITIPLALMVQANEVIR